MIFTNYSQTYASTITALAGFIVLILGYFKVEVVSAQIELILGALFVIGGNIWTLIHRHSEGDISSLGVRK